MQTITLITKIVGLTDLPPAGIVPSRLQIEVQTTGGTAFLEMSPTAAVELGKAIARHMQGEN